MKPLDKLTLHTNSLINACNKNVNTDILKQLQDQVRQDVFDVVELVKQQEKLIETLINESDEGVDYV